MLRVNSRFRRDAMHVLSQDTLIPFPKLHHGDRAELSWRLPEAYRTLSWAIHGGGLQTTRELLWMQVSNSDLSEGVCPKDYIVERLANKRDQTERLVFLTSAHLEFYQEIRISRGGMEAVAVATVGLGNSLRAGDPNSWQGESRTIILACAVNAHLTEGAMLEALSIMSEAKTAAIMEAGILSKQSGRLATGTGTDCQAIASTTQGPALAYSGKHTLIGSLIGEASMEVMALGVKAWQERNSNRARRPSCKL